MPDGGADRARRLDRLLRVRTLQLGQVQADEQDARRRLEDERRLRDRIADLADQVSPTPSMAPDAAFSLIAAAHYRDRLHETAIAADHRLAGAQQRLDAARARTVEARRDQSAMEKLLARAGEEVAARARRQLEQLPPRRSQKRHDPC